MLLFLYNIIVLVEDDDSVWSNAI